MPDPTATGTPPDARMASRTSSIHLYSAWNHSPPGQSTCRSQAMPAATSSSSTRAPATRRVFGSSTTIALRASGKSSLNIFAASSVAPARITQAFVSVVCLRASSMSDMSISFFCFKFDFRHTSYDIRHSSFSIHFAARSAFRSASGLSLVFVSAPSERESA